MDNRSERSKASAMTAAVAILSEDGVLAMTHQAVARRANLGRATVYRHWPTRIDLVLDILTTFRMPLFQPATGSIRERLQSNLELQRAAFLDPEYRHVYTAVQGIAREPRVAERLVELNQERVESVRAVVAPEYHLDSWQQVIDVLALLNGPLLQAATFVGSSSPELHEAILDSVTGYLDRHCRANGPGPLAAVDPSTAWH